MKILHVDDDPVNRLAMDHLLGALGHEPVAAASAAEALQALDTAAFDAVLSDIHMPEADGIDLLRAIRARAGTLFLPVVAVTADVMTRPASVFRDLGFASALAKPILIPALTAVLEAIAAPPGRRTFVAPGMARG